MSYLTPKSHTLDPVYSRSEVIEPMGLGHPVLVRERQTPISRHPLICGTQVSVLLFSEILNVVVLSLSVFISVDRNKDFTVVI